ncbi:MAG: mannosyltransferase family protein [Rhizonema sp. NSF051]|nr:mannosyltransferase family protein [Rhizonema sp. NSF051]
MNQIKNISRHELFFPLLMWLSSRVLICIAMLAIAPVLPSPSHVGTITYGWDVFFAWDSSFYEKIATFGYDDSLNEKPFSSVVFFPLLPLCIRGLMTFGLPFQVAGTLINNLAFLGAVIILYVWIKEHHGVSAARWTVAVFTWCPLSLFGTVIYAEGLYLLFSTAALKAFDQQQYVWTALWGTLATATRPTGIALEGAFLLVAGIERRGIKAYIASLASGSGLFLFSLYCQMKFGDALAFLHAQKAWRPSLGFDWLHWWKMLMQIVVGTTNWKHGYIKDPWHPLLLAIIVGSGYLLWRFRKKLNVAKIVYGFTCLGLFSWLLAGDPLTNVVMIFGGIYLLWVLRAEISLITLVYGFCGIGMLLVSGSTISLNRLVYGIVSVSIALGLLLARHPRSGYAVIGLFTIILASFSIRFAQNLWVA